MTHLEQFTNLNRLQRTGDILWINCEGCQEDCYKCKLIEIVKDKRKDRKEV